MAFFRGMWMSTATKEQSQSFFKEPKPARERMALRGEPRNLTSRSSRD